MIFHWRYVDVVLYAAAWYLWHGEWIDYTESGGGRSVRSAMHSDDDGVKPVIAVVLMIGLIVWWR